MAKCAPNLGEGCEDVPGTVLATFSFRFVILQNIGVEGKKSKRFPVFLFAFKALLLDESGLGFDICPVSAFHARPPWAARAPHKYCSCPEGEAVLCPQVSAGLGSDQLGFHWS